MKQTPSHLSQIVSLSISLLLASTGTVQAGQTWQHDGTPAQLIELFTSEGCSSCPPADRYLSQFQAKATLWNEVIPMAFHVDYWNYLGWQDKFSHPSYTQRQRLYHRYGASSSVYTPGFMVDGKEWQGYFSRSALPPKKRDEASLLVLNRTGSTFDVTYQDKGRYVAHLVLLAMDETTVIRAGENQGKQLEHDFVVLQKHQITAELNWKFELRDVPTNSDAVAVWLTKEDGFQPIQTVAGNLTGQ